MRVSATARDVGHELARRDMARFARYAWPLLVPGTPLIAGVHIDAICAALNDVLHGSCRRLLINVPPRHGKSLLCSVMFPPFAWLTRPELRFLCASYASELSVGNSRQCRALIESPAYSRLATRGIHLAPDQNRKERFENDRGGALIATSVGGVVTGLGGDVIVVDDPHKAEEASSRRALQRAIEWFDTTLATRLNDPKTGAIIVIAQRIHEDDLSGHLIRSGEWEHVCLPARYEPEHPHLWHGDPRTVEGQLLQPERFGEKELEEFEERLGAYAFAGQFQQRPAPSSGGVFEPSWFRWYGPDELPYEFDEIAQSWDVAFGDGPSNDFVAGQLWGLRGPNAYLLHQTRKKLAFMATLAEIEAFSKRADTRFPTRTTKTIYVEKTANGHAIVDVLRDRIPGVIPITPRDGKKARAIACCRWAEAGNIWLPGAPNDAGTSFDRSRTPQWVQDFVLEVTSFPNARHDDQVDAMTQVLERMFAPGPRLRAL